MYDANKIIIGLAISAALLGFPVWYSYAVVPEDGDKDGNPDYQPQPVLPDGGEGCIESVEFMRSQHMHLLNEWRDSVVRDGDRDYVAKKDGKTWDRSLSRTCMSCHTNRMQFCNECHSYLAVEPDCWNCHVAPEKALEAGKPPQGQPVVKDRTADRPPQEGRRAPRQGDRRFAPDGVRHLGKGRK